MKHKTKHPVQPVIQDEHGTHRFKSNSIVKFLYAEYEKNTGKNLNHLCMEGFPPEDWEQFSQLTGYSVSGLCDLSYVTDRVANKGLRRSEKLRKALDALNGKPEEREED